MSFLDNFRHARWIRLTNLLLQAVLFLTLVAGLNYLAGSHAWREDPLADRSHALPPLLAFAGDPRRT